MKGDYLKGDGIGQGEGSERDSGTGRRSWDIIMNGSQVTLDGAMMDDTSML